MEYFLGIDVGGTFIKYGVLDAQYRIIHKGEIPTPVESMEQLLDSFASICRSCAEPIAGVGVSFTATMDAANDGYCFGGALGHYTGGKGCCRSSGPCLPCPRLWIMTAIASPWGNWQGES